MSELSEMLVHVRRGYEFFVLRRIDHGYWHAVAGGVEPGEMWEDAARRELQEEIGLAVPTEIGAFDYVREDWEANPGMSVSGRAFVFDARRLGAANQGGGSEVAGVPASPVPERSLMGEPGAGP
jgi:8-oxo-dGTP pyrophosphatase MutT (NUDIX family)